MFLKVSNAKIDSIEQTVSQDNQEKQAHYGLLQRYWLTDLKIYKISNWLEHSQTSITPAAESKCAVYSDLLHISIYSIFLLIEVCRGCTLKLTVSSAAEMDRKQNTSNSYTS